MNKLPADTVFFFYDIFGFLKNRLAEFRSFVLLLPPDLGLPTIGPASFQKLFCMCFILPSTLACNSETSSLSLLASALDSSGGNRNNGLQHEERAGCGLL